MTPALLCTDEDLYIRAGGDLAILAPRGLLLARGADGQWIGGTPAGSDAWTMYSAVPFHLTGAGPGNVVFLHRVSGVRPDSVDYGSAYDCLIVAAAPVAGGGLPLRRAGRPAGVGYPPGQPIGTAVAFTMPDFSPIVANVSGDIYNLYGLDDATPGRRVMDVRNPDRLRALAVPWTLARLYRMAQSEPSPIPADGRGAASDFGSKAVALESEVSDIKDSLNLEFFPGQSAAGSGQGSNRFGARLSR